jgi:multicomponent Na+:H+ antiporter subunit B
MNKTDVLSVVCRKLSPFIMLFGFYLVTYGYLTPGGGFQGGVVIASGVILLLLSQDADRLKLWIVPRYLYALEAISLFVFLAIGITGIAVSGAFLSVIFHPGAQGRIVDAVFVLMLNIIIGVKVGAGVTIICYYLFIEERS